MKTRGEPSISGKRIILLAAIMALSSAPVYADFRAQMKAYWNFWDLTRKSSLVVKGTVESVDAHVTLATSLVLKGEADAATIRFPAPEISPDQKFVICPRPLRFAVGKEYLVFLDKNEAGEYTCVTGVGDALVQEVEKSIRDLQEFEKLDTDTDKCRMLVSLMMLPAKGISHGAAWQEIHKYNRAEFLELLTPLRDDPAERMIYVSLLGENANPDSARELRELLGEAKEPRLLAQIISALQRKRPEDNEMSKELVKYVGYDSPEVRIAAIMALKYRDYRDADAEVAACLDDEDAIVRATAFYYLDWRVQKGADVMAKIKKLRYDPDERVRAAVYRHGLPLQVSSFYKYLIASLLDKSRNVRNEAARLDLLWERKPISISLLLLWPCIVASGAFFMGLRRGEAQRPALTIAAGLAGGYIAGACAGYLVGRYHSSREIFHAFILMPPFFMAAAVLLSGAFRMGFRLVATGVLLVLTVILCVTAGVVTASNTLWPAILTGCSVMALSAYLSGIGLRKLALQSNNTLKEILL